MIRQIRKFFIYHPSMALIRPIFLWVYKILFSPIYKGREDNGLEFIISVKSRVVFVLNPKVASRSFIEYITRNISDAVVYDSKLSKIHLKYPSPYYAYYAVSRNPITRARSCFKQKVINNDPVIKARIISMHETLESVKTFSDFTKWLCTDKGSDLVADRHWKSQHKLLFLDEKCLLPKYIEIGKIEEIEKFIDKLSSDLNIDKNIKKLLSTESIENPILADSEIDALNMRYKRDFDIFNY